MLSNETVHKLREMHLGVMAGAFSAQLDDAQFQTVSFEDRFAMLVDAEWSARKSNRLTRLIRKAGYADPSACVENIEYLPERKLDREQILRLASCAYLHEAHNVIILGATGAGKTYAEPGTEEQAGGSVWFCGGAAWHRTCEELCSKGIWSFHGRGNLAGKAKG